VRGSQPTPGKCRSFATKPVSSKALASCPRHVQTSRRSNLADTRLLKSRVEPFVRGWLADRFGVAFEKKTLPLKGAQGGLGRHEFDGVSEDSKIVVGIKSSSGKTTGGRVPSGKKASAYAELYFLSLVEAERKYLVLTDREFFELFSKDCEGKMAAGTALLYCPLSDELQARVWELRNKASSEIDKGKPGN